MKTVFVTDLAGTHITRASYRSIVWGYVTRNINGKELLIAESYRPDDPLRVGQLVIPDGGTEKQTVVYAAQREVLEETGVETEPIGVVTFSRLRNTILRESKQMTAIIQPPTSLWLRCKDSGQAYLGHAVALKPLSEPRNTGSDARNPRYIPLAQAFKERGKFTPASRILLEILESEELGTDPVRNGDIMLEEDMALQELLRVTYD